MKTPTDIIDNMKKEHSMSAYEYLDFDSVLRAMREYATQEVKKHLEIAAENAELIESIKHSAIYDTIDKQSITNIQIKLT